MRRIDAFAGPRYSFEMAEEIPSVGGLRRKSEITDAEIEAATDAYLKDEAAPPFAFSTGHKVDVAKASTCTRRRRSPRDEVTAPACAARW